MKASSLAADIVKTLGLLTLWVLAALAALAAMPAKSAPPPDMRLLAAGDTVRSSLLPNVIDLPDGIVTKNEIQPSFAALALDDETIYLWTGATQTVTALPGLNETFSPFGSSMIAFYSPTMGLLEWGLINVTAAGIVAVERQTGASESLETLLSETGSYAVLNPQILPPTQPVPEPEILALLGSGLIALRGFGARRFQIA